MTPKQSSQPVSASVMSKWLPLLFMLIYQHGAEGGSVTTPAWIHTLDNEAHHLLGNGSIRFQMKDIGYSVGIKSLDSIKLYIYEHDPLDGWSFNSSSLPTYELFTINDHGLPHHRIATLTVKAEEYYVRGWRGLEILHKVKHWARRHSAESYITVGVRRVGDLDGSNTRFRQLPEVKPFILVTAKNRSHHVSLLAREKRDVLPLSEECLGLEGEPCCHETTEINLDEGAAPKFAWWLSPRTFSWRSCKGHCTVHGARVQESCRAEYEPFTVTYTDENGEVFTHDLLTSHIRSCHCS